MGVHAGVELDDVELTGPRLVLRRWRAEDAPRVRDVIAGGGSLREFIELPDPYTLEDAQQFVTGFGHEGRGDGTGLGAAMVERATGRVVGSCAIRFRNDDPDVGYWVAGDARGHGYAAEATGLLAQFAFSLGHPRVWLECAVANLASARTAQLAGFRFEGVARGAVIRPSHTPGVPDTRGLSARFARVVDDDGEPVRPAYPPLPGGALSDGTISLRPMRPGDATAYAETEDAESVRWSFSGEARRPADVAASAERAGLEWLVGPAAHCAIVDDATGRYAGDITLRGSGPPRVGGIGYTVHPDFRGRGYTTRALRLLAPWALGPVGMGRLELGAKIGNVASQRAAANAGFEPDGIRRGRLLNGDGTFGDEVRYCLLR